MTDGSSQGLFVIVAVVIFGIFVLISYILFRDNLKVGLANIFEDSIQESENRLEGTLEMSDDILILHKQARKEKGTVYFKATEQQIKDSWVQVEGSTQRNVNIFSHLRSEKIIIPWGYSLEIHFDVLSKYDIVISYDYNASYTENGVNVGNDTYTHPLEGDIGKNSFYAQTIKKDKITRVVTGFSNLNPNEGRNPKKYPLQHYSKFLLVEKYNPDIKEVDLELSNFRYRIVNNHLPEGGIHQ